LQKEQNSKGFVQPVILVYEYKTDEGRIKKAVYKKIKMLKMMILFMPLLLL